MDYSHYLTLEAQVRKLKTQAKEQEALEASRVYAAYVHLASNESFDIVLSYWIQRVVLVDITNEHDMGQHNFVVRILKDLKNAADGSRAPEGLRL